MRISLKNLKSRDNFFPSVAPDMSTFTLSIIIPTYNEEHTIARVLERVWKQPLGQWQKEIIIVDDGSQDNSKMEIQNAKIQFQIQNCTILSHEKNRGKGAAVRTALTHVTGDYAIIQDADLEYDPAELPKLLREIDATGTNAIFGSRELAPQRRGYTHYVFGVRLLTALANTLFGAQLTDIYTCYKLIPASVFKSLPLTSNGFEFEAEVTALLLRHAITITETPISYMPRTFREGKKIRFVDGFRGAQALLRCTWRSLKLHDKK